MRVAFDYQTFVLQEYGGISRYFCRLASQLNRQSDVTPRIFAPLYINRHLPELDRGLYCGLQIPRIPKTGALLRLLSNAMSAPLMSHFAPDIVHHTYYSSLAYAPKTARRVVTVYDMIHERFPELFPARDVQTESKRRLLESADRIICISECTRRDLLDIFRIPHEKVSVVHLGFDQLDESTNRANPASNMAGLAPFVLYVGYRGGHKNFSRALEAFAGSSRIRGAFKFVCFGGGKFQDEERSLISRLGLKASDVIQMSGDDAALAACYQSAAAFIYPSLYEGFGIPPLEAMIANCPVTCSNTSSIPEVVGDAGEYFDPTRVDSIKDALETILFSPTRRNELLNKAKMRQSRFSWARMAEETLGIYREIV